jgi:hypothetical protein
VVDSQPKSRMWYRIGATRSITGGRKIEPGVRMVDRLKDVSRIFLLIGCIACTKITTGKKEEDVRKMKHGMSDRQM